MLVTRRVFDHGLDATLRELRPYAGLYGPDTVAWTVMRESIVYLGAGRAALLQLSHPYVAHAIAQHSHTREDPIGRFNRTFQLVHAMVFGDRAHVAEAARRVRAIHDGVHGLIDEDVGRFHEGHRYTAHEAGALVWVFATLMETAVRCYEIGHGPLAPADKEALYAETKRFGALFGIGAELPPSWAAFERYWEDALRSDTIVVGRAAQEIGGFLLEGYRASAQPVMRWYRVMTAGLMPEPLRAPWGLTYGRTERAVFEASQRAIGATWPHLPERVRFVPAYVEARRRLAGLTRPDRVGRGVEQMLLRFVRPGFRERAGR